MRVPACYIVCIGRRNSYAIHDRDENIRCAGRNHVDGYAVPLDGGLKKASHSRHLVSLRLKGRGMETLYTIETPELTARLNKCEIDILHFVDSWLPTLTTWAVEELAYKCDLFAAETLQAVDMLILHGLLVNDGTESMMGRRVRVPDDAVVWIRENSETINSLYMMNDTELFTLTDQAEA